MLDHKEIDKLAKILWDYHKLDMDLERSDLIFVLCSNDIRVAEYAAKLYLEGWARRILFSGGISHNYDVLATPWNKAEAEVFSETARKAGVPQEKILVESKSTNTGENILFSFALLKEKGLEPKSMILVQKPFMLRRTYATFKKQWPGEKVKITVTCPDIEFENFPNETINKDILINTIVGDTQRIKLYAEKGFQIPQDMPDEVWGAYEKLVELGYTKHLVNS